MPAWLTSNQEDLTYTFWKRLPSVESKPRGEIDLCLESKSLLIGIEVKYESELAVDSENNQLVRYWRALEKYGIAFRLIYLTQDLRPPLGEIRDALKKGEKFGFKVGWISWSTVHAELKALPRQNLTVATCKEQMIIQDMVELLEFRGLTSFLGFPNCSEALSRMSFTPNTWFETNPSKTIHWPAPELKLEGLLPQWYSRRPQ